MRNNISVTALSEYVNEIKQSPEEAIAKYGVELDWQSGTRSLAKALPMEIGPHKVSRDFSWSIDEPRQLLGSNHAPNPQEYLLSGLGACIMVGFMTGASLMKIQIEALSIRVKGNLDLRGFLGVDDNVQVAFDKIEYQINVAGDGTREQFEAIKEKAISHSPNAMSLQKGVKIEGSLVVKES